MEYTKIYRDLQPILNKKLRKRKLLCVLWGMLGMLLFFLGGWFFAIIPFVILILDFVFKNNINHKGLTLIRARVLNKISQSTKHTQYDKSQNIGVEKYCFELHIYEADFLSCVGKVKTNKIMQGLKTLKVGECIFKSFEPNTEVTLVVLSNKKCVAYLLNGEVRVA